MFYGHRPNTHVDVPCRAASQANSAAPNPEAAEVGAAATADKGGGTTPRADGGDAAFEAELADLGFDIRLLSLETTSSNVDEQQMREIFNSFDVDGNGSLSRDELALALPKMGMFITMGEIDEMVASADTDGNGDIDFDEFVALTNEKNGLGRCRAKTFDEYARVIGQLEGVDDRHRKARCYDRSHFINKLRCYKSL